MAKYSRTNGGEVIEHFDTLNELEKKDKKLPKKGSLVGCFLLFVIGVALAYFLFGLADAAKWIKAVSIFCVAVPLGVFGYKNGELTFGLIHWILITLIGICVAVFIWFVFFLW